jgi:hypothetical protein
VATGGSLPKIWATQAPDGLGRAPDGLGRVGVAEFVVLPRGGYDDSALLGRRQDRHVAAGLPELYGSVWAWLGQCGSAVLLVFCPADGRRSVVAVGSSRPAELLSHILVLSCILTLSACYCSRRDSDSGCKIVVARAYGR